MNTDLTWKRRNNIISLWNMVTSCLISFYLCWSLHYWAFCLEQGNSLPVSNSFPLFSFIKVRGSYLKEKAFYSCLSYCWHSERGQVFILCATVYLNAAVFIPVNWFHLFFPLSIYRQSGSSFSLLPVLILIRLAGTFKYKTSKAGGKGCSVLMLKVWAIWKVFCNQFNRANTYWQINKTCLI